MPMTTHFTTTTEAPTDEPVIAQTPENTIAPHEALPETITITPDADVLTPAPTRDQHGRFLPGTSGASAPNQKPRKKPGPKSRAELAAMDKSILSSIAPVAPPKPKGPSQADVVLKALVEKLVAFENDPQYRAVWSHFFNIGGVYTGPRYIDELKAAIAYLIEIEKK